MRSPAETPNISPEQRLTDAESARDLALQELEKSKRAHSEFVTRLTHEFRTPLNAILGFAQILAGDAQLNERQRLGASTILDSGHNLLRLMDSLLEPIGADAPAALTQYRNSASSRHVEPELEFEAGAIPPQEEIAVLHGLALAGSMREILERAQWIEGLDAHYTPFTRHVAALARAYESQRVLSFIAHHHRLG
jgi:signal transduction histidine kinase